MQPSKDAGASDGPGNNHQDGREVFLRFVSVTLEYAKENPVQAALESGDIVEMRRLEVASRDQGAVVPTAITEAPQIEKKPE